MKSRWSKKKYLIVSLNWATLSSVLVLFDPVQQGNRVLRLLKGFSHFLLNGVVALAGVVEPSRNREHVLGVVSLYVGIIDLAWTFHFRSLQGFFHPLLHTYWTPIFAISWNTVIFFELFLLIFDLFLSFHKLADQCFKLQWACWFCIIFVADLVDMLLCI